MLALYGVQHSIESLRPLLRTAGSVVLQAWLSADTLSGAAHATGTTIGAMQHETNGNDCRPVLAQPGSGIIRPTRVRVKI